MASRDYERIGVVEFSKHLLSTGDLDPVYLALNKMQLPEDQLHRWLIAYTCLYHCGASCWLSEHEGMAFWEHLGDAAINSRPAPTGERWPRGHERRHFRGMAAAKAIKKLMDQYGDQPERMVEKIVDGPLTVRAIMERVKEHYLFGDWIAFKWADLLDAVLQVEVDQSDVSAFLYDTPRGSIIEEWRRRYNIPEKARPKDENTVVLIGMDWLRKELWDAQAMVPHKPGAGVDNFALETCWCKHASHMHGHYPLLNDITEINEGLASWVKESETAALFGRSMPGANSH